MMGTQGVYLFVNVTLLCAPQPCLFSLLHDMHFHLIELLLALLKIELLPVI
jgi:hypothetical protein